MAKKKDVVETNVTSEVVVRSLVGDKVFVTLNGYVRLIQFDNGKAVVSPEIADALRSEGLAE